MMGLDDLMFVIYLPTIFLVNVIMFVICLPNIYLVSAYYEAKSEIRTEVIFF